VFEKLYLASRPLMLTELPPWEWDSKRTLLELARHIEQTHIAPEMKDSAAPSEAAGAPPAEAKDRAS